MCNVITALENVHLLKVLDYHVTIFTSKRLDPAKVQYLIYLLNYSIKIQYVSLVLNVHQSFTLFPQVVGELMS